MRSSTIAAIATGPGAGAVGIVRLSGPRAIEAARTVAPELPAVPPPRSALRVSVVDAQGQVLDDALALVFPAPRSLTGEDVVELQLHGSPRLLALVLARLTSLPEVRAADPGEFTRRAVLNGKLDLTRAEGVAALVEARSEAAVRAAAAQLGGALARRLQALGEPLLALRADVEAALDFPEEVDDSELHLEPRLRQVSATAHALRRELQAGAVLSREPTVVLYGPVNAGKSSLFNALLGAERALVDEAPGTTRDVLQARVEWQGLGLVLLDTAGLRPDPGRVEALGIELAQRALAEATLGVRVVPASEATARWDVLCPPERRLDVASKSDLGGAETGFAVSATTGQGLETLRAGIVERLAPQAGAWLAGSQRHLDGLEQVCQALGLADEASHTATLEVVAGELARAAAALDGVTGAGASEAVLDSVFARFCLGK